MHYTQEEKYEIIRLVEESELGINRTLKEIGLHKTTFYNWYNAYLEQGYDGLARKKSRKIGTWNKISEADRDQVVEIALDKTNLSPRELAWHITDTYSYYISESSVYRILKQNGLISVPSFTMIGASDRFQEPTTRVNQMWQTDFTYFKIVGWGWYYLSTVIDDYSRFIVHCKLYPTMKSEDVIQTIDESLLKTGIKPTKPPKLLSDNGACYIAQDLKTYLQYRKMKHVRGRPMHPQTQGKIERYHRSMKNVIKLDHYYCPEQLERAIQDFVRYYNYERYHESLDNVTPAEVYFGTAMQKIKQRKMIKIKTLNERRKQYQYFNLN